MANPPKEKFEFDVDFQWEIIKTILTHKRGYKLLFLISYEYFDLNYQKIITRGIDRYFKRKKKVVPTSGILNEELRALFKSKDYARTLTEVDRDKILKKSRRLFKTFPKDPDEVFEKCKTFASFVKLRHTLENIDVNNFEQYAAYARQIQKAVNIGMELDEKPGSLMVSSARTRLFERRHREETIPTPWDQLNKLSNAGGYQMGSIFVLMDKPKKSKTMTLVNLAVSYAKKRAYKTSKVIYFDLENGEDNISCRVDQCLLDLDKMQVLSGKFDDKLNRAYRKMHRFGCEIYVRRMPNQCTTADLQKELDDLKQSYGLEFQIAIIDYIGIMGALSGKTEDVLRISDAYLDVKNWARQNNIAHVWTGHHVIRKAYNKRSRKYAPDDMAKCIDIERHVDGIFGLQQSAEDAKRDILRMEVIEQRDGLPYGRCLFKLNIKTQRLKLMSPEFHREYTEAYSELFDGVEDDDVKRDREDRKLKANKTSYE